MTYRLIFGQDKRSWKLCKSLLKQEGRPNCLQRLWKFIRGSKQTDIVDATGIRDPLLTRLCCQDCNDEKLYDDLYFPDVSAQYSAQQDFPFFGRRLLALQEYTRMLQPHGIWTLWYDRRDLTRFYMRWLLVVLSITILIIALEILGLSAALVARYFKPQ